MTKKEAIEQFGKDVVDEAIVKFKSYSHGVGDLFRDVSHNDDALIRILTVTKSDMEKTKSSTGMIHDTDVERAATIAFLKKTKLYNIHASAHEMQLLHTLYWTIKDRGGIIK